MEASAEQMTPSRLLGLATSYRASKLLMSAVEVGLFTALAAGPASADEIADRLVLHPRAVPDFLDALAALGLLVREGSGYRNSPEADQFLDSGKSSYIGGYVMLNDGVLYRSWGGLANMLHTGGAQTAPPSGGESINGLYHNPDDMQDFMTAMDGATIKIGPALARAFEWQRYTSFVDVGGARGNLAAIIVAEHSHLVGGCFELPPGEKYFHAHMKNLGMDGKIQYYPGDFFHEDLPQADVLIMGHVLHDWDVSQRRLLVGKANAAINPGGALIIYDAMIDDERTSAECLLGSLNMMLISSGGSEYSASDCRGWLAGVGFTGISSVALTDKDTMVVGYKRS